MNTEYSKGLAGVIADETKISNVEGDIGRLTYRGYLIEDLVHLPYERVVWLVLFDELPNENQEKDLARFLMEHAPLTEYEKTLLTNISKKIHPMVMLQSLIPLLDLVPKRKMELPLLQDDAMSGLVIVAKIPSLIAGFHQLIQGNTIPDVDSSLGYYSNFLNMFNGLMASKEEVSIMEVAQILQIDHGFNAGTFAGRVTASTLSPIECVVSASIGTLYGKLHGGADQAALEMAMEVGSPDKAADFVQETLKAKGKIMGMGHREYKTVDPRAKVLKPMAEQIKMDEKFDVLLETLKAVEKEFRNEMLKKEKDLWANVDYYKGLVFYSLGIEPQFFTSLFAMARTVGYVAHFIESRQDNRLIRPKALYTGRGVTPLPS